MLILSKKTKGVVLIDEIDMHLHPKWQRTVIQSLKETFPNIQFIITTHSPFIVQSLSADEIINLDGNICEENPSGLTIDQNISFMGVDNIRSTYFEKKEKLVEEYMSIVNNSDLAKDEVLEKLEQVLVDLSNDPL